MEAETEIRRQYINAFIILYHSSPWSCDSPISVWLVTVSQIGSAQGHVINPKGRLCLWAGAGETPQTAAFWGGLKWGEFNYADTYTSGDQVLEGFPGRYIKAQVSRFLLQSHSRVDRLKLMLGRPVSLITRTFSSSGFVLFWPFPKWNGNFSIFSLKIDANAVSRNHRHTISVNFVIFLSDFLFVTGMP